MEPSFKADLSEYISQCKLRLQCILQTLNWTEATTLKDYHANSITSSSSHELKKTGSTFKPTFPSSCVTENSVVLETPKLQDLLKNNTLKAPDNFVELQSNFSREQKLKLYEHAIENTKKLEINLFDKEVEGENSLADILAQKKREEKKNKRRFRKSKPTHIEEVRCLVHLQMQALEQFLDNKSSNTEKVAGRKMCFKQDDCGREVKYKEDRTRLKEYGRKEPHRERYADYHEMRNYHTSRSKERSSNQELSCKRKRSLKSPDRKRRRSISSSEDIRHERKKHKSKRHHKSKERRKHSRRSRSSSRKVSKKKHHRSNRRSRSQDRNISKGGKYNEGEYNGLHHTYTSQEERPSYSKHSKEKYNKYYRKQSSSPEMYRKRHKS